MENINLKRYSAFAKHKISSINNENLVIFDNDNKVIIDKDSMLEIIELVALLTKYHYLTTLTSSNHYTNNLEILSLKQNLMCQIYHLKDIEHYDLNSMKDLTMKYLSMLYNEFDMTYNEFNSMLSVDLLSIYQTITHIDILKNLSIIVEHDGYLGYMMNENSLSYYNDYEKYYSDIDALNEYRTKYYLSALEFDNTYDYMLYDNETQTLIPYNYENLIKILFHISI